MRNIQYVFILIPNFSILRLCTFQMKSLKLNFIQGMHFFLVNQMTKHFIGKSMLRNCYKAQKNGVIPVSVIHWLLKVIDNTVH